MKALVEIEREAKYYQSKAKSTKLTWQKKKNKMTHLTPKSKKRKD